jgi:hypothetical protein
MSASTGARVGHTFGAGAVVSGLAFLVAATVLNIAHDRMPDQNYKMETLPFYIGTLYATTGKTGVTLLLVTIGMASLLLGLRFYGRDSRGAAPADSPLSRGSSTGSSSALYTASQQANAAPVGGRIVLETWKYVTPPNGSPGGP